MSLQKQYDELDEIISRLDILINDITNEDYISQLEAIKIQAERELEDVEPRLLEQREQEEREMELVYERSVV